jgi:2-keto-4-pentenoate hydratase/2-oxohepta-3-ene-1,7-dioic acid hydratase in catechol pathway
MDKIICVGKNYLKHAEEMGEKAPEHPILFLKPPSSAVIVRTLGETIKMAVPRGRGPVHHECEIICRLSDEGTIDAVSLGLDMTLRDVQLELKKKGLPWEVSKVFENSAAVGPWISLSEFRNYLDVEFTFTLEGGIRQKATGNQMRFSPQQCIDYAKEVFPVRGEDVLSTGSPEGVGPVVSGQTAEVRWGNRLLYRVQFV